jgi:hypothetical protein
MAWSSAAKNKAKGRIKMMRFERLPMDFIAVLLPYV